ncbi:MAG TPA: hypothetical protein VFA62_10420 [Acidimicrobiia bacterium]|nr:hypothetical protein [Acidimicrobiia bacterium]
MQPFERLRYLARWSDEDDSALVSEAADCLAGFADDPAGLVVACRRLLSHHPAAGALWWLCARVLTAPDPADAAWEAWQLVNDDQTADRLAGLLPFPHDEPIAVLGWPDLAGAALAERPDLDVIAVRRRFGDDHRRARLARREASIRIVSDVDAAALEPSHVLVEAMATGPTRVVVAAGALDLLDALASAGTVGWLVAGVGRVLPARLFATVQSELERDGDEHTPVDLVDVSRFARVAGPSGLATPDALLRRVDCPVAPELLRLA